MPLVSGWAVEVQVRTRLLWAQGFERVADKAGRGIRYGVVPPEWADQIEGLQWTSENVADIEKLERDFNLEKETLKGLLAQSAKRAATGQDTIRKLQLKHQYWEKRSAELKTAIRAKLTAVIEGTEDLT